MQSIGCGYFVIQMKSFVESLEHLPDAINTGYSEGRVIELDLCSFHRSSAFHWSILMLFILNL